MAKCYQLLNLGIRIHGHTVYFQHFIDALNFYNKVFSKTKILFLKEYLSLESKYNFRREQNYMLGNLSTEPISVDQFTLERR